MFDFGVSLGWDMFVACLKWQRQILIGFRYVHGDSDGPIY